MLADALPLPIDREMASWLDGILKHKEFNLKKKFG